MAVSTSTDTAKIRSFVKRWKGSEGGQERANYALFLHELCLALNLPVPDPASASTELNDYVFERSVRFIEPDGSSTTGRIDLYKKAHFVLEAKQSRLRGAKKAIPGQSDFFGALGLLDVEPQPGTGWDILMQNARASPRICPRFA
jgi:hypothetical protein